MTTPMTRCTFLKTAGLSLGADGSGLGEPC